MNGLQAVGPHAVHQLIFPAVGAGRDGHVVFVDQNGLDVGGTKLNADDCLFQIQSHRTNLLYEA